MIYLIRHGETEANAKKQYLGVQNSPLTDAGLKQHQSVVASLAGSGVDRIISSPRRRCVALAEALCTGGRVTAETDGRIAEINFGIFETLTYEQAKAQYPEEWAQWETGDSDYTLPRGESIDTFDSRVCGFARELLRMGESGNVAVVTHGGVICFLLCCLLGLDASCRWRFQINNGSIIRVDVTGGYAYLVL